MVEVARAEDIFFIECPFGDVLIEGRSTKHTLTLLGIHLETVHKVKGAELRALLKGF